MTEFSKPDPHDVYWAVRRMPKHLFDLMKAAGPKLIIAGGYLRACISGEELSDIDVFSPSREEAKQRSNNLADQQWSDLRYRQWFATDNAFTVKLPQITVQFIHRWVFDHPGDAIASFDFTIACAAIWWDGDNWQSLCDAKFYSDLAAKRLVYRSSVRNEDAGGSMLQVLKFYQRGYRIPLDSLGAVIARLANGVDEKAIQSRMERLGQSREFATAFALTGLLREVDPLIDPHRGAYLPSEGSLTSPKDEVLE